MGSSQSVTGRDGLAPGTINSATPYDSDADYEDAHEEIVTLSPSTSAGAARAGDEPVGATLVLWRPQVRAAWLVGI